jgi:hypothetical protein
MSDPVKHVLNTLRAILCVSLLILLALVSNARAFSEGDIRQGRFIGCDSLEDARAFFGGVEKVSNEPSTCGMVQAVSIYIKEVETLSIEKGKVTIHLVTVLIEGAPPQYVATFTKLEDM